MVQKYKKWLEKENLLLINGWKRSGLSDLQMAANMEISPRTYYNWQARFPEFKKVTALGHEHANFMVENALFKKAINGNVTAMIFWLKNNMRERYSDTQRTELEEQLTKEQIKKVMADTAIANARAEMLNGSDEDATSAVSALMDMLLEAGKDKEDASDTDKTTEEKSNKPK